VAVVAWSPEMASPNGTLLLLKGGGGGMSIS